MAVDYGKKTNAELIDILKSRSLPHNGKKADLVARLQESDKTGETHKIEPAAEDVIDWDDDTAAENAQPASSVDTKESTRDQKQELKHNEEREQQPKAEFNEALETNGDENKPVEPTTDVKAKDKAGSTDCAASAALDTTSNETQFPKNEDNIEDTEEPAKLEANYSIGLASTDLEAELARRRARAEKFGTIEDSETALREAEKAVKRAKRFGTDGSSDPVAGLDQALSADVPRKRSRGSGMDDAGHRGKRRYFRGRGRGRGSGRIQGARSNGGGNGAEKGWSEEDRASMEKRRQRFG